MFLRCAVNRNGKIDSLAAWLQRSFVETHARFRSLLARDSAKLKLSW